MRLFAGFGSIVMQDIGLPGIEKVSQLEKLLKGGIILEQSSLFLVSQFLVYSINLNVLGP